MSEWKPKLLGAWDVAQILWVSLQYIDQLVREDKIPHQKISSWTVFFEEDIIVFAENRRKKAENDKRIKFTKKTPKE